MQTRATQEQPLPLWHVLGRLLRSSAFQRVYVMFALVAAGGLLLASQLAPMIRDLRFERMSVFGFGSAPTLTSALLWAGILNAVSRVLFGYTADKFGPKGTVLWTFALLALCLFLIGLSTSALAFVVFSGLAFLFWGQIFVMFPMLCRKMLGDANLATNFGVLYTAKGVGALAVPIGSLIATHWGWPVVFMLLAMLSASAAMLAAGLNVER